MLRTALVWLFPALLVAGMWVRLENPRGTGGTVAVMLVLALLPALLPRRSLRLVAVFPAALAAGAVAFDARLADIGAMRDRASAGLQAFYDVSLPFSAVAQPYMAGLVAFAIFAFALLIALAVAERRPIPAALALAAGAGWPATLLAGGAELTRGALILAGILVLFAGLRGPGWAARPALLAGIAVVLAAAAASTSASVARGGMLDWQNWNPYERGKRVGVDYVWAGNYAGIRFPDEATTVFEVEAPREPRYWRSTTLDAYVDHKWDEDLRATFSVEGVGDRDELLLDDTLAETARIRSRWLRQRVTIRALRDEHLPAASIPVAYDTGELGGVIYALGGLAFVPRLSRGDRYTVWSHAPAPEPAALNRLGPDYPDALIQETASFSVWPGASVPPFGTPGREDVVEDILDSPVLAAYAPLYRTAQRVVGDARTPYAAAVGLETWFRRVGGFSYDEQPGVVPGKPPLVGFVIDRRAGYCQHYAGAMALMLRYLGVPARVAAGFTSGSYKRDTGRWVVTDYNGHAWVEVWFPRYGWLPFDPTPGRGTFDAAYSNASPSFDAGGAATALLGTGALGLSALERLQREQEASGSAGDDGSTFTFDEEGSRRPGLVSLLVLAALGLLVVLGAAKAARRRLRYLTQDPRRIAAACRREVAEVVADQQVDVPAGATVSELAELINESLGVDPRGFVTATSAARYGPPDRAGDAAARARREVRGLRRALRQRLTLRQRLRGVLSLRSLRLPA